MSEEKMISEIRGYIERLNVYAKGERDIANEANSMCGLIYSQAVADATAIIISHIDDRLTEK